jgi:hypothetical protein
MPRANSLAAADGGAIKSNVATRVGANAEALPVVDSGTTAERVNQCAVVVVRPLTLHEIDRHHAIALGQHSRLPYRRRDRGW